MRMTQYEFDLLLQKYLEGKCTPDEERQMMEWSENMLTTSQVSISSQEKEVIRKRIWRRLSPLAVRPWWNATRWRIAASISLILACGAALFWSPVFTLKKAGGSALLGPMQFELPKGNIEVKNTSDKPYLVRLGDGSEVTLKPQSSLSHPEHFSERSRIVYLSGEAFFNVRKDANRPFFVYTEDLITRVLGTSFNVRSFNAGQSVEVSVITGRVSVYENRKKSATIRNGIILNPNQKIRFDRDVKVMVPELVDEPVIVHPVEKRSVFIFEETPLPQVTTMIQEVYGIEIVLESPALETCVFTGDINDLPLYSQLKLICKSINATYELRGTTLFMSGEGCRNL